MPRLFHANFHFETELAGGTAPQPRGGSHGEPDRRGAWLAVARPGDMVVGPEGVPCVVGEVPAGGEPLAASLEPFRGCPGRQYEFVPWGWSRAATKAGRSHGCSVTAPPLEVVERVNRRSFRATLEQELAIAPEGLCVARSFEEVSHAVARIVALRPPDEERRYDWVLQAEYGMAGREAVRGIGALDDPRLAGWVAKRLARSGVVVVEPWLSSRMEGSVHFDIPLNGPPVCLGVVGLTADATGTYRSSRVGDPSVEARFASAVEVGGEVGGEVAERLQRLGYWGPLGLDVMDVSAGRSEAPGRIRPLQDLNARWTMGRLAWEWWRRQSQPSTREWSPPTSWPPVVQGAGG
jgi:hypothetical protein